MISHIPPERSLGKRLDFDDEFDIDDDTVGNIFCIKITCLTQE